MNYTQEQIAALADKGAEAAYITSDWTQLDNPARIAFARAVIDGAEEMKARNETDDLISREEWRSQEFHTIDARREINRRHAARVADLQAELTDLHNWKAQMLAVEAEWDEQALAKKLGVSLGQSCRKGITEGVERLLKENEELKAQRSPWTPCAEPPAEEWIPLGPEDVSGNDIFRAVERNERAIWFKPVGVMSDGICLANLQLLPWQLLFTDYERSRDDGQTWQPCKKPCTPTPQPV